MTDAVKFKRSVNINTRRNFVKRNKPGMQRKFYAIGIFNNDDTLVGLYQSFGITQNDTCLYLSADPCDRNHEFISTFYSDSLYTSNDGYGKKFRDKVKRYLSNNKYYLSRICLNKNKYFELDVSNIKRLKMKHGENIRKYPSHDKVLYRIKLREISDGPKLESLIKIHRY